jgi:hypothetical protein
MIRRRAAEAGFEQKLGYRVFRATRITAFFEAGGTLVSLVAHNHGKQVQLLPPA